MSATKNLQHAGLGRLRGDEEPDRRGEVQPGGRHQLRLLQEDAGVAEDGLGEGAVVEVPAQLFGTAAEVLLTLHPSPNVPSHPRIFGP